MKVGVIGLGVMGCPMAANLRNAGHELYTHSRRGTPQELSALGAIDCASPEATARVADVIITMLPDTPDVGTVLFGSKGVAAGLSAGKLVIDMSSISPIATREYATRINELGCEYLDAPVSGGDVGARSATLTIMVGGPPSTFERALPLLQVLGKTVSRIGASGAGQTAKIANQIIVALTIEAVSEALLFASKAGVDPAKVRAALMGGFASSRILEIHGERMIRRAFRPGFRIELHRKDLNLALAGAQALGLPLPHTASCLQLFNACIAHGAGKLDHSAMIQALERAANHALLPG